MEFYYPLSEEDKHEQKHTTTDCGYWRHEHVALAMR